MKNITVAFDIDWTLRNNQYENEIISNERIRTLLITLSTFKNIKIVVWSWGWELYAQQCVRALWISKYVDKIISKNHLWKKLGKHQFEPEIIPDIAIDDIQDCELWIINLICKEK